MWKARLVSTLLHADVCLNTASTISLDGAAVGTPVVGLCGPSYWPGFQDYERFRMIRKSLPCSPCLRHPTCAHFDCMAAIGVEETVRAVAEFMATEAGMMR